MIKINNILKKGITGITAAAMIGASAISLNPSVTHAQEITNNSLERVVSENIPENLRYKPFKKESKNSINYIDSSKTNKPTTGEYLTDFLKFGAGFAVQYGAHELGHLMGAKTAGANINFEERNWEFSTSDYSDSQKLTTYISGFALPMAISETALRWDKIPKDDSFTIGLVTSPFLQNLVYVIKDIANVKKDNRNDFEGMERAGLKRELSYPILLGLSGWQAYRGLTNPNSQKRIQYLISPNENGGANFTLHKKF